MALQLVTQISPLSVFDYPTYVYNSPSFLKQNNDQQQLHFYGQQSERVLAHVAFSVKDKAAYCPMRSPFGGIEYSPSIDYSDLLNFLAEIERDLINQGVNEIQYHQPPTSYQSDVLIKKVLEELNYTYFNERLFHGIQVTEEALSVRMHKMEQRKYKLCVHSGSEFKELRGNEAIEALQWIEKNRSLVKKPASMSWYDLNSAREENPNTFLVFGVFMDDPLIAATVLVQVNDKSVYHFLPTSLANSPYNSKYSPMVFLVNELYKWCQTHSIGLLDLGTSYVDGELKDSLVQFKEHIGGTATKALSWSKRL